MTLSLERIRTQHNLLISFLNRKVPCQKKENILTRIFAHFYFVSRCPVIRDLFWWLNSLYPPALSESPVFAPPGGGRRLRVLCQAAAGDAVLGSELLRRVWQRGRHDERGRNPDVLLPGMTQSSPPPPPPTRHRVRALTVTGTSTHGAAV